MKHGQFIDRSRPITRPSVHRSKEFEGCSAKEHRTRTLTAAGGDSTDPRTRTHDGVVKQHWLRVHGWCTTWRMQTRLTHELLFERKLRHTIDAKAMGRDRREIDLEARVNDADLCEFNGPAQRLCRKLHHRGFHHGGKPLQDTGRVPRDHGPQQHACPSRIDFCALHGPRSRRAHDARACTPEQESQRCKRGEITAGVLMSRAAG